MHKGILKIRNSRLGNFVASNLHPIAIVIIIFFFCAKTFIAKDFGGDFIAYFLPHYQFVIDQIRENKEAPLWYPYSYFGIPEFFKSELAIFHPVTLFVIIFNVIFNQSSSLTITGNVIEFAWLGYLAFGAVGLFYAAHKTFKVSKIAALTAALAFALNPLMLPTMNTNVFLGVSVLPWLIYALNNFIEKYNFKTFMFVVFFNYLLFASGYPYFYVYFFIAQLGYVLFYGYKKAFAFIVAYGTAVLISAFFLLPGIYIYTQSVRDNSQSEDTFQLFTSNIPTRIINILNPMPFGSSYSAQDPSSTFTSNGVSWGTFLLPFLALGFIGLKKKKKEVWLALAFIIAFIYSFGGYMDSQKFFGSFLPIINKFRSHSISLVITMMTGAVFIALGLDKAMNKKEYKGVEIFFWGVFLILFLGLSFIPIVCPSCSSNYLPQLLSISRTAFLLFASLIIYRLTVKTGYKYFIFTGLFIALLEFNFYFSNLNGHFLDTTYANFYRENTLVPNFSEEKPKDLYRVYFDNNQFSYNTSYIKQYSYGGYETIPYKGWYTNQGKYGFNESLRISNVRYFVTTNPSWDLQNPSAVLLKDTGPQERANETFMSSMPGIPYLTSKATNIHYVYELNNYLPRIFVPDKLLRCNDQCAKKDQLPIQAGVKGLETEEYINPLNVDINIEVYKPNSVELKVKSNAPAFIVMTDTWDSGWSLSVNGKKESLQEVSNIYRGFWVGKGESQVKMTYSAPYFNYGVIVSVLGVVFNVLIYKFRYRIFK
jgi:hypothetical protein